MDIKKKKKKKKKKKREKKKKKKKKDKWREKKKERCLHRDSFVQKSSHFCVSIFSPDFSPIRGDCIWWVWRENIRALPDISLIFSPNQATQKLFSLIFSSPLFSSSSKSPQPNGLLVVEFVLGCYVKKISKREFVRTFSVGQFYDKFNYNFEYFSL